MLLNSIWDGSCVPAKQVACRCSHLMRAFAFPVLILEDSRSSNRGIRVYFDDAEVSADVALGDVVNEELGVDMPGGSCIVVTGNDMSGGLEGGFSMAAEVLHAVIVQSEFERELSLFDWALRSLSARWRDELCAMATDVDRIATRLTARIAGHRGDVDRDALVECLGLIEPGFEMRATDPALFDMLSTAGSLAQWRKVLIDRFMAARMDQPRSSASTC